MMLTPTGMRFEGIVRSGTTLEATVAVVLKPLVKAKLKLALTRYLTAYTQLATLTADVELEKQKIAALLAKEGVSKVELEGFKVSEVHGTYKDFDEQKYVELGGSLAHLRGATEERPKKPYWKITVPKPTS